MSSEDVLDRELAMTHLDSHTPMALEVPDAPKPKRRGRLTEEEKAEREAAKVAAREARAAERERKKAETAARKLQEAHDARQAKLDEAEGGRIALPAVVLRDGTCKSVDLPMAADIVEQYLDNLCLDCWTGDAQVITQDGVKPISELAGTSPNLLVPTILGGNLQGTGTFKSVPVNYLGEQETYEVTLSRNGVRKVLRATAGHKWFTTTRVEWPNGDKSRAKQRQFKKATRELKAGDRLQPLKAHQGTCELTYMPVAAAQGFVHGDGTAPNSTRRVHETPASVDVYSNGKDHVMVPVFEALGAVRNEYAYKSGDTFVKFSNLPRSWKALPAIRESRNFLLSWLAGYFLADGKVSENGVASLDSVSQESALFVRDIAAVCGIDYLVREYKSASQFKDGTIFNVRLRLRDLPSWFFLGEEHAHRATEALKRRELRSYWKVVSVESTGKTESVYCAEVPEVHAFAMDGSFASGNCETSGYWIGHQHYELRTVQLGGEEMAVVFDADSPADRAIASWALNAAEKVWAHSTTADACPVVLAGLIEWDVLWAKLYDSVIKAKLVDPKLCGSEADKLKDLARDILREYAVSPAAEVAKDELFKVMKCGKKTDVLTEPEKNGWYQVSKFAVTMIRYAGSDVLDLAAVLRMLPPLPVHEEVMERERENQASCAVIAYSGFPLDLEHIRKKIRECECQQKMARYAVEALTGGVITNPASSKDVLDYLTSQGYHLKVNRKTQRPSAGKDSLEPIAKKGDMLARNIVEYRHMVTTLGLLLRQLENLCTHGDGIMRPTVYTINAKTGRMSCVRPNSQQFSRQGGIRACVRAPDGYRGISADFSGCELRVAAALSGDRALYEAETGPRCHRCGSDAVNGSACLCGPGNAHQGLHWLTAHTAFGEGATKEDRYNSKRCSFTRLFGGGPQTAADQIGIGVSLAGQIFEAFSAVAPEFTAWDRWLRECYEGGYEVWRDFRTGENYCQKIPGAARHMIYRTYSGRSVYVTNGAHAAGNGAIQGTARELLVDGILRWRDPVENPRWHGSVLLPVHDEVICMVSKEGAEQAALKLKECMESYVLSTSSWRVFIGAEPDAPWESWADSS